MPLSIRPIAPSDLDLLGVLRAALWPEGSASEHIAELRAFLDGEQMSTLPSTILVATDGQALIGFAEVGLRSHADGCDTRRPVGFLEGWFVADSHRRRGVGAALLSEAEAWCAQQGATEIASDTWIDEEISQHAHEALGFEVVDRCVHYKKAITPQGAR